MAAVVDFHSQIASVMEVLANAAVAEICKVVDDGNAMVHLEMSRSQKENEFLRKKIKLLELQVARYRAERVKGAEGSISSRFHGVRLLTRQNKDLLSGSSLQGKTRFLNRGQGVRHPVQKSQSINLDQDPDQEVVTTTKTESSESEEEGGLLIVKVEGAVETTGTNNNTPLDNSFRTGGEFSITEGPGHLKNTSSCQSQEENVDKEQAPEFTEEDPPSETVLDTTVTDNTFSPQLSSSPTDTTMDPSCRPRAKLKSNKPQGNLKVSSGGVLQPEATRRDLLGSLMDVSLKPEVHMDDPTKEQLIPSQPSAPIASDEPSPDRLNSLGLAWKQERVSHLGAAYTVAQLGLGNAEPGNASATSQGGGDSLDGPPTMLFTGGAHEMAAFAASFDVVAAAAAAAAGESPSNTSEIYSTAQVLLDWQKRHEAKEMEHFRPAVPTRAGGTSSITQTGIDSPSDDFTSHKVPQCSMDQSPVATCDTTLTDSWTCVLGSRTNELSSEQCGSNKADELTALSSMRSQNQPLTLNHSSSLTNPPVAMGILDSIQINSVRCTKQASSIQKQDSGSTQQQIHLPYACSFCSHRYTHQWQLRSHEHIHKGEKPYKCTHCGKSFDWFCSLKRHQMVHTGEKPFSCTHCGKRFSASNNLKVHQSVHTGERFYCSKCSKSFSFLSNLIRHQALH